MDHRVCLVLVVLLLLGRPLAAGEPAPPELLPHLAVYRMTLAASDRPGDVVGASGMMVYRFGRECDGWTVENKTVLRLTYTNDTAMQTVWSFVSWESADGRQFRFRARYDQDDDTLEKITGSAEVPAPGQPGEARLTEPDDRRLELPAGTLFPTAHMRAVLAAAAQGQRSLNRVVFDGASLENPYQVNAYFGPLATPATEALARAANLPVLAAFWTRMAFFPLASAAAAPEFEIDAQYRADGIADAIRQSFERFSLDVRLERLEKLPTPDC